MKKALITGISGQDGA